MSTSVTENSVIDSVDVMVKAFGDEPARLKAVLIRPGVVEAIGADESAPMGFPEEDVYQFNKRLFQKLNEAYGKANRVHLAELWSEAKPFQGAGKS